MQIKEAGFFCFDFAFDFNLPYGKQGVCHALTPRRLPILLIFPLATSEHMRCWWLVAPDKPTKTVRIKTLKYLIHRYEHNFKREVLCLAWLNAVGVLFPHETKQNKIGHEHLIYCKYWL